MRKVQTSSQKRYVERLPCRTKAESPNVSLRPLRGSCADNEGLDRWTRARALCYLLEGRFRFTWGPAYLERQSRLDLLLEGFRNGLVEVGKNLHGELGVNALGADQIVEHVHKGEADATLVSAGAQLLA